GKFKRSDANGTTLSGLLCLTTYQFTNLPTMRFTYDEFDLSNIQTSPLKSRKSKARAEDFATRCGPTRSVAEWVASLPDMLAAADFKAVVRALVDARANGGGIMWGFGAHVIKTGLGPLVIDLMERGFVSALATNGAGVIHDFEVALSGATSEGVDDALGAGRFGMAEETGRLLNAAINEGVGAGLGYGQAVGRRLVEMPPPHARMSLLATAARRYIRVPFHVGIATDVIHMHPDASGAAIGEGSLRDFRYFVSNVARLEHGVYLNCGSAVVLPEVFLKAVALARNQGRSLAGLTTANFDFIRHYRAQ